MVAWEDADGAPSSNGPTDDPRGWYFEAVWLPVLGPTASWLVRRLADALDVHPGGFELSLDALAGALGVGGTSARHGVLDRAIGRCCRYELARRSDPTGLAVRRRVPPVPAPCVLRLPAAVQALHHRWVARAGAAPDRAAPDDEVRRAALEVATVLGTDPETIERCLHRLGVHPALAYDAARWAAGPDGAAYCSTRRTSVRSPKAVPPLDT